MCPLPASATLCSGCPTTPSSALFVDLAAPCEAARTSPPRVLEEWKQSKATRARKHSHGASRVSLDSSHLMQAKAAADVSAVDSRRRSTPAVSIPVYQQELSGKTAAAHQRASGAVDLVATRRAVDSAHPLPV
eukprot:SAG31_NODE_8884_length_1368_cov_1.000000_1_plen_132_part_10